MPSQILEDALAPVFERLVGLALNELLSILKDLQQVENMT